MNRQIKSTGFTLVEIMVSVLILAILSGVIVVLTTNSGAKNQADILKVKIFAGTVKNKLAANMVGDWSFSEGTGTIAYDGSEYKNNVSINGATWATGSSCVSDNCLSFNGGTNNYIDLIYAPTIGTGEFTTGCWFKASTTSDWQFLLNKYTSPTSRFDLYLNASGNQVYYNVTGSGGASSNLTPATVGSWHYVALTRDNGRIKFYVDSVLVSDAADAVGNIALGGNFFFGRQVGAAQRWFKGYADDISIYNDGISISQVQEKYLAGLDNLLATKQISQEEYNQRIAVLQTQTAQK